MLCSKFGGAMRPTNVTTRDPFLLEHKCVITKEETIFNHSPSKGK
jgi:hypothetical protein